MITKIKVFFDSAGGQLFKYSKRKSYLKNADARRKLELGQNSAKISALHSKNIDHHEF